MANWKKVIVSGSNADLHHITASGGTPQSASISASGYWYGDLPEADNQIYVVVYDTTTGELKSRLLTSFPGVGG